MTHSATRVLVWAAALTGSLAQSPVSRKQFDVAARAKAEGVAGRLPIQLMVHRETRRVEILVVDHVERASEN
jgi:hypothetical protein